MIDTNVDWDQLVDALRDELQEKGGLIRLLNQQTETLYRGDAAENERLEEQIRVQLRTISRCTQSSGTGAASVCLQISTQRRRAIQ